MFKFFTGSDVTKFSAVVPQGNVGSIPVTANGKSGYVKVPLGLPPGAIFYFRAKDMFQKPAALHPTEGVDALCAPVAQPAANFPYGQQPVAAAVVSIAPITVTGVYVNNTNTNYYPQNQIYNSNSAATAPSAVVYENNSTKTGYVATSQQQPKAATYRIEVPIDARPGQTFHCMINNEKVAIVVPPGAYYGCVLTLQGPAPAEPSAPPMVMPEYADIPIATIIYCEGVYYNGYTGPSAPPQQY